MPITKSAKKNLRKSKKRYLRNLAKKKKIKELRKKLERLIKENKIKEAKNLLSEYYQALDKAAKTGVIKENKASREKSKFAKLIAKFEKQSALEQTQVKA